MATIGLSEAARLTGKPRSTIHRAMKAGRLSYTVAPDGARSVEVAELERVFPAKPPRNGAATDAWDKSQHEAQRPASGEIRVLRAQLEAAEARLADKDAVIADLGRRLDLESEERRRLTAVLADQRVNPSPDVRGSKPPSTTEGSSPAPARRRCWWRFGR